MRPTDRARLTTVLRDHVARIATDLRGQLRPPGPARERAQKLWTDEQVGEDFDVWTDLLSRRAAVLWVLKSVYVRVLEDKGLLSPGRLLDPESQQLFEKLAPNLGESAFLRWVYRDLSSSHGGLPELFAPQPAEVATPSDENSRALIEFWRHRDADSGAHWSFAEERFEGELMGDLYQELDPVVKERFALCQTPDFVRAFILDRTLTPAMETFGADTVRLLDPACGSGHFLIDGLKRLVAATTEKHKEWEKKELVRHCLNRVVGIDLNDYACALARARLVMTAAELAGVSNLIEASAFHPHVYWADGLEQVEKGKDTRGHQLSLLDPMQNEVSRASLTRPEVRAALGKVLKHKFHAVVANPPYITEKDAARKEYHREKVGKRPRYISAHRQYSLGAPFTERCFQLAVPEGFAGLITGSNFMKREFGKPLIEEVLTGLDLTLVVDTSQAYIPFHGTPTVMLFGRNRSPQTPTLRVTMGRRGETGTPENPAHGRVWSSIAEGWNQPGFENEFVTVVDQTRTTFNKHPWSLGGGGAAQLRQRIEFGSKRLGDVATAIGFGAISGEDDIFLQPYGVLERRGVKHRLPLVAGDVVRDWRLEPDLEIVWPNELTGETLSQSVIGDVLSFFWHFRTNLKNRKAFGIPVEERGLEWWEVREIYKERFRAPLSIGYAFVATHNHFVLDPGGKVFKQSAPVIKLLAGSSKDDHLALLGLLNSSSLAFWMRQVCFVKGGESTGKKRQSEEWSRRLEYDATKLQTAPVVDQYRDRIIALAKHIEALAVETGAIQPNAILAPHWQASKLSEFLTAAESKCRSLRDAMVAWQEELDWTVYAAFGFADAEQLTPLAEIESIASEHRPFAIRLARQAAAGTATHYWFEAMNIPPATEVPTHYRSATQERLRSRLALLEVDDSLALLEAPEYKRKWEPITFKADFETAAFQWLAGRVEVALRERGKPATLLHIVASVQDDERLLALASIYQDRRDIDMTSLISEILKVESVPSHSFHIYTESGLPKRIAWEQTWDLQRREDAGEKIENIPVPPEYSQGSRGKVTDFLRNEYWQLRGKLDVPKERFIAFTEVPGRDANNTLYGWAGWTPVQRLKALLSIDEELEDAGIPLTDRIGVLDSAWRLLPDVAREDAAMANRLKAELQALVGTDGPSREQLDDWRQRFPPPGTKAARAAGKKKS